MMVTSPRRPTLGLALALALGVAPLLAACGSDDATTSTTTSTTAASGYEEIPMADVLVALPAMLAAGEAADAAAAAGHFDEVLTEYDVMHEVWEEVEGTIKATDRDLYEEIETAQSLVTDGGETENEQRVATGVRDQATAVEAFVERYG